MCSKAFWAENSNFEFSWQTQLQSWLRSVLSDFGGGGWESCAGLWPASTRLSGIYTKERKQKLLGYSSSSGWLIMIAHLTLPLLKISRK